MSQIFGKARDILKGSVLESAVKGFYVSSVPLIYRDKLSREFVNPYSELEDSNKVIFVHIPKNAGNGVAQSLFGMDPKGHNFLSSYKKVNEKKFSEYYKFSFTRNVYSRFYSAYSYLLAGGFGVYDNEFADLYVRGFNDFNDFVSSLEDPSVLNSVISWTHFIPQTKFLLIDGVNHLDYLGSVENMQLSLEEISKDLGLKSTANIKINSSPTSDYKTAYNEKSIDIISRIYKDDIFLTASNFE